jgi:hypothetical protein
MYIFDFSKSIYYLCHNMSRPLKRNYEFIPQEEMEDFLLELIDIGYFINDYSVTKKRNGKLKYSIHLTRYNPQLDNDDAWDEAWEEHADSIQGSKDINGIVKFTDLMIKLCEPLKSSCLKLERMVGKVNIADIEDLFEFTINIDTN